MAERYTGVPRTDLMADELLIEYEKECWRDDFNEIGHAISLGIPYDIYKNRLEVGRMNRIKKTGRLTNFSLGRPWQLTGDHFVIGDLHVPFTDWEFVKRIPIVAKKLIRRKADRKLVIAGDYFNFDTFSTYTALVARPTWSEERLAAKIVMDLLLDTFSSIHMIMGNHDRRIQKFTMGAFDENDLLALIGVNRDKVFCSGFGYCELTSGEERWRITHPKNYSINQLTVADALSHKFRSNIMTFHEHHLSIGWDRYKNSVIVNGGCLMNSDQVPYVSLDDSKSAGMAKGFSAIINGTPYLFGEYPFTDWSKFGLE